MNGDPIIQRMGIRIANLVVENEMLRQENLELNELIQKQTEVIPDGVSSKNP